MAGVYFVWPRSRFYVVPWDEIRMASDFGDGEVAISMSGFKESLTILVASPGRGFEKGNAAADAARDNFYASTSALVSQILDDLLFVDSDNDITYTWTPSNLFHCDGLHSTQLRMERSIGRPTRTEAQLPKGG